MKLEADEAGDAVGAVDRGADLLQFGKGLWDLEPLFLHQVHAGEAHHHGAAFP